MLHVHVAVITTICYPMQNWLFLIKPERVKNTIDAASIAKRMKISLKCAIDALVLFIIVWTCTVGINVINLKQETKFESQN